jgi:hypothetical protein
MATTAVGLGDFTNAYKQAILPYIQDNIPEQAKLLKVIRKNDNVRFVNNTFVAPIRSSRHGGVTNLASDKTKIVTGSAGVVQASITPKIMTGTFDISDMVMKASSGDKGAVESAMEYQTKTLTADFSKSANRQYWSDGVGVIAQVPASGGSVGVGTIAYQYPDANVDDGRVTAYYGNINGDLNPGKYLAPGMLIGIGTAGAGFGTIVSVAKSVGTAATGTIVVTGAVVTAANDSIYIADGDLTACGTAEIQGVRKALSEGTANYAGLNASTVDVWNPQYMGTAANQALTINNMEVVYMNAFEYAQPGDRYAWFMNRSLYAKFGDLLTSLRRTANQMELTSGWSGISFEMGQGNVPVMLDFDVPDGEAILLNLDTWTICEVAPLGEVGDGMLRRSDYTTFQKVVAWYTNNLCVAPAANGRMVRQTK